MSDTTVILICPKCGSTNVIETDWEEADGPGTGDWLPMTEKCRDCGASWDAGHADDPA